VTVDYGLTGKVAIVTGAGRGIGASIALALAGQGANVVVSDIRACLAHQVAGQARALGVEALALAADVASEDDVAHLVDSAHRRFGRIDILVNNAGVSPKTDGHKTPLIDMDRTEWDQVVAVNLSGSFDCSRLCARIMAQQRYGKIVNIASAAGRTYIPVAGAHYIASKTGAIGLTRALAGELACYGINVNAIAPGRTESEMMLEADAETNRRNLAQIPLGRFGKPDDVAHAVLFLVSDRSSFITGAVLGVDGGRYMV
jgi:3-oxoacyl-[acyl-carrier protein] reductase